MAQRDLRFIGLMAELDDAYAEYRKQLQPATKPLRQEPVVAHDVDWDAWRRARDRYDKANEAVLALLRGEEPTQ